jgi:hypothetical protein
MPGRTPARLQLIAAAYMRLTVAPAIGRALALILLRGLLLAHLVNVIFDLAAVPGRTLLVIGGSSLLGLHVAGLVRTVLPGCHAVSFRLN